jgi:hypothetical protein
LAGRIVQQGELSQVSQTRDISFVVSPIRNHAFFKEPQFQGLLGDDFLQFTRFTAKSLNLTCRGRTGCIAGKPALTSLKKLLRLFAINALGDAFTTAQLGNGFFTA